MITVTLYVKSRCESCEKVKADLQALQSSAPHQLAEINIESDPVLTERYGDAIPVVQVGPYRLRYPFTQQELHVAVRAASDRANQLNQMGDEEYQQRIEKGHTVTKSDKTSIWFTSHYMILINLLLLLYVGLPIAAPTLAKAGWDLPARVVYTVYKPLCHQLAFRSWFLFGPQEAYPLELAHVDEYLSYEQVTGDNSANPITARAMIGSETMGYKIALCQRDMAIWGMMLVFGIIFAVTNRRIKSIPWYVWVIVGLIPMGLDGTSQLPSYLNLNWDWLPLRESTPFLRTITGGLFGLTTAWFLFPMIEDSMRDTRSMVSTKVTIVEQLDRAKK